MDDVDSDSGSDGEPTSRIAAVLVQTCDKYSWFWPAWHFFFHRAWKAGWEVYLMTEELDTEFPGIRTLRTGSGCFSDRLTAALSQLPHQYVLYVQDDFWPVQQCPALTFQRLLSAVQEHDMHFLRLLNEPETRSIASGRVAAAECDDGSQVCGRRLLRMHPESPFLLSHQSTLWRRELLLECMRDGENAFENEVLGTQRLQARFADHPSTLRAFALRFDWYRAVMGSPGPAGKLNAYGEVLQKYYRANTREATAVCSPSIAGSGTASTAGGTSGHPEGGGEREGWLYTAALLPPEWRGKLSGADAAYKRLEALFAQATGAAGGKPPEVRCPLCGDVYRGHSAWYSFRHPCPQRRRAAWFSQQRSDASQSTA